MWCVLIVVILIVVFADASFRSQGERCNGVLDETFSVTEDRFGEHVIVEVRPGATQDVMEVNNEEYVDLFVAHQIAEQFHEREGLRDALLLDLWRVFDEHELEKLADV